MTQDDQHICNSWQTTDVRPDVHFVSPGLLQLRVTASLQIDEASTVSLERCSPTGHWRAVLWPHPASCIGFQCGSMKGCPRLAISSTVHRPATPQLNLAKTAVSSPTFPDDGCAQQTLGCAPSHECAAGSATHHSYPMGSESEEACRQARGNGTYHWTS
jgi:hypothetical protein